MAKVILRIDQDLGRVARNVMPDETASRDAARLFLQVVMDRMDRGVGQGTYSTRPAYYNPRRPPGGLTRIIAYQRALGRRPKKAWVFFEQGYAEFRAAWKGEGMRLAPVDFNMTGEFRETLGARFRTIEKGKRGVFELYVNAIGRRTSRITNTLLAEVIAARRAVNPLMPNERERAAIIAKALRNFRNRR